MRPNEQPSEKSKPSSSSFPGRRKEAEVGRKRRRDEAAMEPATGQGSKHSYELRARVVRDGEARDGDGNHDDLGLGNK